MQKDLTKIDFAKNKTDFKAEFNAIREQLLNEARQKAKAKGWLNYIKHVLTQQNFVWN